MKADAVSVVECGYAVDLPEQEWVRRVCETAFSAFGIGLGCTAYVYDGSGASPRIGSVHSTSNLESQSSLMAGMAAAALPLRLFRELHSPAPRVASLNRMLGTPLREHPANPMRQMLERDSVHDFVGVRAGGADQRGLALTFPLAAPFTVAPPTRQALERVAAHLAAAFRLRQVAAALDPELASAVLSPAAKLEHVADAEVRARTGELVDAVRRMQRTRGRRKDAEGSLAEWRALVAGKWSVLDFVDRDGKRFILARRNELVGQDLLAITDVEREVLELAALGHANKHIAYELGVAPSTVTACLKRGLRRLGLKQRAELIGLAATRGEPDNGT